MQKHNQHYQSLDLENRALIGSIFTVLMSFLGSPDN